MATAVTTTTLAVVVILYVSITLCHAVLQRCHAREVRRGEPRRQPRPSRAPLRRQAQAVPSVDVVVPCRNERPELLRACCSSLAAQEYPGKLRVWLVDDYSVNRAELLPVYREFARLPGWKLCLLPLQRGKREAQAVAVREGHGALVVTVDSDTVIAPDGIDRLAAHFGPAPDLKKVGAVTGNVRALNRHAHRLTRLIDQRYEFMFGTERAAQARHDGVLCCSGPFSMYRRTALRQVLGDYLRQTFRGQPCVFGDDIHLTILVLRAGWRSRYDHHAHAWTEVPSTLSGFLRQQARWNRSLLRESRWAWPIAWRRLRRDPFCALDLVARTHLPRLLVAGALLAVVDALAGGPAPLGLALVAAMLLAGAVAVVGRTEMRSFVLQYGVIYLALLLPVRLWAWATLGRNHWGTRELSRPQRLKAMRKVRARLAATRLPLAS